MRLLYNKWFFENNRNLIENVNLVNPDKLIRYPLNSFVEKDNCCFFKKIKDAGFSEEFIDETGSEAFYNKIYIEDFLEKSTDLDQLMQFALDSAITLAKGLKTKDNGYNHTVVLAEDDDSVSLTFFRNRKDQIYIEEDELESVDQPILLLKNK